MMSIVIADKNQSEAILVRSIIKDCIAMRCGEEVRIIQCRDGRVQEELDPEIGYADLLVVAVNNREDLEYLKRTREFFGDAYLFLLVNEKISPTKYVRPYTRPLSLVCDTCTNTELYRAIDETVEAILKDRAVAKDFFRIETRQGITQIPYSSILFFEAMEKKIKIRLENETFFCRDTLDHIFTDLPDHFARCHRGFIVNAKNVEGYLSTENLLLLKNGESIPVSKSYKRYIRNIF